MRWGLKEDVITNIQKVFSHFPEIEKVILYGSRAKGNYKNGSDIDLSIIGEGLNLSIQNKIELALDELYLPYTFDISLFHQISNEELIEHINRVGIFFYERDI